MQNQDGKGAGLRRTAAEGDGGAARAPDMGEGRGGNGSLLSQKRTRKPVFWANLDALKKVEFYACGGGDGVRYPLPPGRRCASGAARRGSAWVLWSLLDALALCARGQRGGELVRDVRVTS